MENKVSINAVIFSDDFIEFKKDKEEIELMLDANKLFIEIIDEEEELFNRKLYVNEIVDLIDYVCGYKECEDLLDEHNWFMFEEVTVTCPKHGDFLVTPNNHLKGEGCPYCDFDEDAEFEEKFIKLIDEVYNRK